MTPSAADWLQGFALLGVEIAVVILVAAGVHGRIASGPWQRLLWQVTFLSMLLLVAGTVLGVSGGLARQILGIAQPARAAAADSVRDNPQSIPNGTRVMTPLASGTAPALHAHPVGEASATLEPPAVRTVSNPVAQVTEPASFPLLQSNPIQPVAASPQVLSPWPFWVWLAGFGVLALRQGMSHLTWFRLLRRSRPVSDASLKSRFDLLRSVVGAGGRIALRESAKLQGPVALGVMRPAIVLPRDFAAAYPSGQQQVMLAHELAHLAARDPLWYQLADWICSLLWWHPAVWFARDRLHAAAEGAADEASLVVANGPGTLAECLVAMGNRLVGRAAAGGVGIEGTRFKSGLGRRVTRLLQLPDRGAWTPPNRARTLLIQTLLPILLVLSIVLSTAWASPRAFTQGETAMKTLRQSWKQSLAAVTLATALGGPLNAGPADQGASKVTSPVPPSAPVPPPKPAPPPAALPASPAPRTPNAVFGLTPPKPTAALSLGTTLTPEQEIIHAKLKAIVLPEIRWEGVPLDEVIRNLSAEARKLDPEGHGINFILTNQAPDDEPRIDPNTGLPLVVEQVSLGGSAIYLHIPMVNVRLSDALDIIQKASEVPVQYSIENYGVLLRPGRPAVHVPAPPAENFEVRTFHVEPEILFKGMESAFGVRRPSTDAAASVPARDTQTQLFKELFRQLGINLATPRSVFFNEHTGIVMVRVTTDEMLLVEAAMRTLGGTPTDTVARARHTPPSSPPSGGGYGGGGIGGSTRNAENSGNAKGGSNRP